MANGKARGITLIENLISLLVFSSAAFGWMSLMTVLATKSSESEVGTQANLLGQAVIDELRSLPYDGDSGAAEFLTGLDGASWLYSQEGERVIVDGFYTVNLTVTRDTTVLPERADVAVEISWADSGFGDSSVLSYQELLFSRAKPR
jgi:Tfp pilus assembly protein PilV